MLLSQTIFSVNNFSCPLQLQHLLDEAKPSFHSPQTTIQTIKRRRYSNFIHLQYRGSKVSIMDELPLLTSCYFRHNFCRICGVQSFYVPRSNPEGVAVMPHCITSNTITIMDAKIVNFHGKQWEESFSRDKTVKHMA